MRDSGQEATGNLGSTDKPAVPDSPINGALESGVDIVLGSVGTDVTLLSAGAGVALGSAADVTLLGPTRTWVVLRSAGTDVALGSGAHITLGLAGAHVALMAGTDIALLGAGRAAQVGGSGDCGDGWLVFWEIVRIGGFKC